MTLGVILTPYGAHSPYGWYAEIAQARGGKGSYLPQPGPYPIIDRFYSTRGEVGYYYDTQLGRGLGDMIPTDAELAKTYACYTPVDSGWINTPQGFLPTPWRFGWNPAGQYGPPTSLSGLGQVPEGAVQPVATTVDLIAASMKSQNDRMFKLAIVSTTAVSISALFAMWARWRRVKHELAKLKPKRR